MAVYSDCFATGKDFGRGNALSATRRLHGIYQAWRRPLAIVTTKCMCARYPSHNRASPAGNQLSELCDLDLASGAFLDISIFREQRLAELARIALGSFYYRKILPTPIR